MSEDLNRKRRAGGRAGNKQRAGSAAIDQMPWRVPVNPDRPTEPMDMDGVMAIHKGAMKILSEIGIEFLNPDAVAYLKQAGCRVNGTNVRMDEDFVMDMLKTAPDMVTGAMAPASVKGVITTGWPRRAIRIAPSSIG